MISSIAPPEELRKSRPTLRAGGPSADELPDGDYLAHVIARVNREASENVRHREPPFRLARELFGRARPLQRLFESVEELRDQRAPVLFRRGRFCGVDVPLLPLLVQPLVAQDDYVLPPVRVPNLFVNRLRMFPRPPLGLFERQTRKNLCSSHELAVNE